MDSMTVQELREAGLLVEHEMYQCDHVMKVWKDEENPYFILGGVYVCEVAPSGILGIASRDGFVFTATDSTFSPLLEAPQEPEKVEGVTKDIVVQPHHYTKFAIEPITFIMRNKFEFWRGNIIKYTSRAGSKAYDGMTLEESEIVDLKKSIRYAEMRINELQGKATL